MNTQYTYDVIVAGGGVAGVAAALEAARSGMKTALAEKTVFTGGLATTGLINIYLPLCDGHGHQVTFGVAEELLHRSIKYGPGDIPDWKQAGRFMTPFSPASFALALDEALREAYVDLWLDSLVCGVAMRGNRVTGIEIETKGGRILLHAAVTIDATGDADVAARAGAPCVEGTNLLAMWAIEHGPLEENEKRLERRALSPMVRRIMLGSPPQAVEPTPDQRGADLWTGGASDARAVTGFVIEGRRRLLERYRERQGRGGAWNRHTCFPVALPAMAQFRRTRRIAGRVTLTSGQAWTGFEDSIGLAADWRRNGMVWEIPFGTLIPRDVEGLLAAGRCVSSEEDAWEITRVIPAAALTGQAAGAAAALSVRRNCAPSQLDVSAVQRKLGDGGLPLTFGEAGLAPEGRDARPDVRAT